MNVFDIYALWLPYLVSPLLPVATLERYEVLQDDGIGPVSLDVLKKYLRVDGNFEDDLILELLRASISKVEQMQNVSLTGKHIHAVYTYGQLPAGYLPFSDQIQELIRCEQHGNKTHFEYITAISKDPKHAIEVMAYCRELYENRTVKGGKKIFV